MGQINVLPGENFAQYEERRSAELTRSSEELMNPSSKFNEYIDDGDWVIKLRSKLNKSSIYNLKNYTNSIACAEYKDNGLSDVDCVKNIFSYRKGEKAKKGSVVFGFVLLFLLLYALMGILTFALSSSEDPLYTYSFIIAMPVAVIFLASYSTGNLLASAGKELGDLADIYGTFDDDGNLHVSQAHYDRYKRRSAKKVNRKYYD